MKDAEEVMRSTACPFCSAVQGQPCITMSPGAQHMMRRSKLHLQRIQAHARD